MFLDNSMKFADRVRRKLTGRKDRTVAETADYMPEIFEMDDVYLYGFWGCERYYKDITGLLRQKIRFPKSGNPANIETLARMEHENAVSVHIRRKDYLTVASGARYMGICTQAYYQGAFDYIRERVEKPVFYIFSDDAAYAKAHFSGQDFRIVDWNTGKDSLYDMELMSHCRHNICANSTFSFWGARLNGHAGKIMIRPSIHKNTQACVPQRMKQLWAGWTLISPEGVCI